MTSDTSPRPIISPLRARMIEDMSVRGLNPAPSSKESANFRFLRRPRLVLD